MVALLTFPITTFPGLFRYYHDIRQVQTLQTLSSRSTISGINYHEIEIYRKVNGKQNKHGEPRENQLKAKLMTQKKGMGRP